MAASRPVSGTRRLPMSTLRRSFSVDLDGRWDFQLRADPASASDRWDAVEVPSLWTMDPRFGIPHYTNVPMPFAEVPPHVPADNPVGVYRRVVDLQPESGRRIVLHVGAAEGALRALVNGREVGASTDSHLAAEFDITDALIAGENVIELQVTAWSPESYIEDQDQWWQHGLARSVGLIDLPEVHLDDLRVEADYDAPSGRGSLRVTAVAGMLAGRAETEHTVRFTVLDSSHEVAVAGRFVQPSLPRGRAPRAERPAPRMPEDVMDLMSIRAASAPVPPELRAIPGLMAAAANAPASPAGTAVLQLAELDVDAWSAETPALYDLVVELIDRSGVVVDREQTRIGFRRVEIVGRDLLVNGRRILVQGVNRHDIDPRTGRVMSLERMRDELALLKRGNVNAIRTSHYPNDPRLLDLCDEFGFDVVDEADVEGHAFASTIADRSEYLLPIVERVQRMVLRDRNHPSVITWSLGNETGFGAAHDAAAAWVRRVDPSRPVQYEGAIADDWHGGRTATDIVCPMYPSFAALEAYARDARADRPLISCEYAYSQGNGTGGLAEYWRLFETLPGLQGGFIWEFLDHALDRDGDGRFRYGGDFGDEPNDGIVLLNGIVFSDLTPKPAYYEMRGLFAPVRIVAADRRRLRVRNRQAFADLSAYAAEIHVDTVDGPVARHRVDLPELVAGAEGWLLLPDDIAAATDGEGALAISLVLRLRAATSWADAGTEIATVQATLPHRPAPLPGAVAPALLDDAGDLRHPLLARPPRLCLWRALTDHDQSFALDNRFVRSGFFRLDPVDVDIVQESDRSIATTRYATAWGDTVVHRREISLSVDGDYVFVEDVTLPEGTRDGLRVGVEFELIAGFADAAWVGLGPWENYPDRRSAALLGRWELPVDDWSVPYLRPSENGTRGGVTALEISGPAGLASVRAGEELSVSVGRHSVADLEGADHWWELPQRDGTIVHLDIAHRGVGTGLLGPDTRPSHRLIGDRCTWSWTLRLEGE